MNAVTPTEPKSQMTVGGDVAAFVPQNLSEAFRLSQAMYGSQMAPASFKSADQVLVAMMAGAELGMKPFQAVQSFAVINGRPSLWGDGFVAVLRANGIKIRQWFEGAEETLTAYCEVVRPDNGEVTEASFSVADAKKAGLWGKSGPWQQYPRRMLQKRALGFAGRDGAADVLKGFQLAEEVDDYAPAREVHARPAAVETLRLEAETPEGKLEIVDEDDPTGDQPEVVDAEVRDLAPAGDDPELFPGDPGYQRA